MKTETPMSRCGKLIERKMGKKKDCHVQIEKDKQRCLKEQRL